jgi:hypothetical protein
VRPKVASSAPEAGLVVDQIGSMLAALLKKRSALATDLAAAEDAITCLRR